MKKTNNIIKLLLQSIFILFFTKSFSQTAVEEIIVKKDDSSVINKIYNYIKLDSPNCITHNTDNKFNIYYNATGQDTLSIYLDNKYLANYSTYYDFNFPNLIASVDYDYINQDSKIEIINKKRKIVFTVDKENKSVLIKPSFDIHLVETIVNNDEKETINFDKKYHKQKDSVVVECFNFDYVYEYITSYTCFKKTGKKLFDR